MGGGTSTPAKPASPPPRTLNVASIQVKSPPRKRTPTEVKDLAQVVQKAAPPTTLLSDQATRPTAKQCSDRTSWRKARAAADSLSAKRSSNAAQKHERASFVGQHW